MDQKEYLAAVKDLELSIDRLRSLFDQYFRGIERMPPSTLQKRVENKIRTIAKIRMKNTALRFRFQTQIQKYTTFLAYWQRMIREIEEGKVKRGKVEDERPKPARVKAARAEEQTGAEDQADLDIDIDLDL